MTSTAAEAIRNAHAWFEVNSGWAPPDEDNLAEWVADGVCRCPDECIVAPDAWCEHGLASWWLILRALDDPRPDCDSIDRRDLRRIDLEYRTLRVDRRSVEEHL